VSERTWGFKSPLAHDCKIQEGVDLAEVDGVEPERHEDAHCRHTSNATPSRVGEGFVAAILDETVDSLDDVAQRGVGAGPLWRAVPDGLEEALAGFGREGGAVLGAHLRLGVLT
jgi:hypothetical protein